MSTEYVPGTGPSGPESANAAFHPGTKPKTFTKTLGAGGRGAAVVGGTDVGTVDGGGPVP